VIAVFRQRTVALLWFGQFLSLLGDWTLFIGLPIFVYSQTGSALATGAMFIAQTLPYVLFGSVAGVFVDRWDRRWTMVVVDLLRALLLFALLPAALDAGTWLWLIYPTAFAETTLGQFFYPARSALMPTLVAKKDLLTLNALMGQTIAVASLVGPSIGGIIFQTVGMVGVIVFDGITYALSAVAIQALSVYLTAREGTHAATVRETPAFFREWATGINVIVSNKLVYRLFAVMGMITISQGIITVLLVPFVKENLGNESLAYGWLITAQGVGGILGGVVTSRIVHIALPSRILAGGARVAALVLFIRNHVDAIGVSVAVTVLFGIAAVCYGSSGQTLFQSMSADAHRGRVLGVWGSAQSLMTLLGMLIASTLGSYFLAATILDLAVILLLAASVLSAAVLDDNSERRHAEGTSS